MDGVTDVVSESIPRPADPPKSPHIPPPSVKVCQECLGRETIYLHCLQVKPGALKWSDFFKRKMRDTWP